MTENRGIVPKSIQSVETCRAVNDTQVTEQWTAPAGHMDIMNQSDFTISPQSDVIVKQGLEQYFRENCKYSNLSITF